MIQPLKHGKRFLGRVGVHLQIREEGSDVRQGHSTQTQFSSRLPNALDIGEKGGRERKGLRDGNKGRGAA